MLAGYFFPKVTNLGNFGDKRKLRKYRLSLLLYTDEETSAPKREDLLWIIWPVGFRIRNRH